MKYFLLVFMLAQPSVTFAQSFVCNRLATTLSEWYLGRENTDFVSFVINIRGDDGVLQMEGIGNDGHKPSRDCYENGEGELICDYFEFTEKEINNSEMISAIISQCKLNVNTEQEKFLGQVTPTHILNCWEAKSFLGADGSFISNSLYDWFSAFECTGEY